VRYKAFNTISISVVVVLAAVMPHEDTVAAVFFIVFVFTCFA
jgi:hypothetical protein